jgi:hypothetical protein
MEKEIEKAKKLDQENDDDDADSSSDDKDEDGEIAEKDIERDVFGRPKHLTKKKKPSVPE